MSNLNPKKEIKASIKFLTKLLKKQGNALNQPCAHKGNTEEMRDNIQSLCRILRGHVSKWSFICQSKCGGSVDTAHQLRDSIQLLVVSVQVLKTKSSETVGQKLHTRTAAVLQALLGLVGAFAKKQKDVNTVTGVVWRSLDALAEVELSMHATALKQFNQIAARLKDVFDEMNELKDNCTIIDAHEKEYDETQEAGETAQAGASQTEQAEQTEQTETEQSGQTEQTEIEQSGQTQEEELENADDFDFDAFFDDAPEFLTANDIHRVELFLETLVYFRRICLDIVIWMKRGMKYSAQRYDEHLEGVLAHLKLIPHSLDNWGASLHTPQDPEEVYEQSTACVTVFQEFVEFTNTLPHFARRKIVQRGKSSTGREWKNSVDEELTKLYSRLEIVQSNDI